MLSFAKVCTVALGVSSAMLIAGDAIAQDGPPLNAAAHPAFPPMAFKTVNGQVTGFVVDLGEAVAKEMGRPFKFVEQEFSGIFAGLYAGHFDVIIAPLTITEERSKSMAFTEGYIEASLAFLIKDGAKMDSLEMLRGKVLAVNNGGIEDNWAKENVQKYGFEIRRYMNVPDAVQAVQSGQAFASLSALATMAYLAERQPGLAVSQTVSMGAAYAFAVKPDNLELRNKIDAALECLKKRGTLAAIYEKWLKRKPPPDSPAVNIVPGYGAPNFGFYDGTAHELKCRS